MGQKTNPNSFQKNSILNNQNFFINTFVNSNEYSNLLKHNILFSSNLSTLFNKCCFFIKNCFFLTNSKKYSVLLFLSFFITHQKKRKLKKIKTINYKITNFKELSSYLTEKIFKVFLKTGYSFKKRIIIQNLNKCNLKNLSLNNSNLKALTEKYIGIFKKEIYYKSSYKLINVLANSQNSALLFGKFFSFFFKIFYKAKRKIKKFFSFIIQYLKLMFNIKTSCLSIKGIKMQIKGRFSGDPRSSLKIFQVGSIPLQTIISNISYCILPIFTKYGVFGVKIWIYN